MEELFEKYWRGLLEPKAKLDFEEQLHNDEKISADYRSFAIAAEASKKLAFDDLKAEMTKPLAMPQKQRALKWWPIAAIILPLTIVAFLLATKTDSKKLFAENFKLPSVEQTRSDVDIQSTFAKLINSKDCAGALKFIDQLSADRTTNYYRFYEGICHLSSGDYEQAETLFGNLIQSQDSRFQADSEWYSLLTAIAKEDEDSTKKRISMILAKKRHPHLENTRKINRKIRSPLYNL